MITTTIKFLFIKTKQSFSITLKENLPIRDKIFYLSDGCGENFINLCHHQQDLNMNAEWILFATSHGRPGDGVGGLIC